MDATPFKPQLTPNFLTRCLHLKLPVLPRPNVPFASITTDSRKVVPGCLFVALKGEKYDGNDFIENAIAQGARGILCRRGVTIPPPKDVSFFQVEDPLAAYRKLASSWRKEFSIPMIVVAGSAGKTTTKELLAAILRGKWQNILKTLGSQNGFVGIPMTLLELRPEHEAAIIEVGIDEIGAMQQHMTSIQPNASVLTAIGPEHLEKLRDVPTVAREEGLALSFVARAGGMVAVNLDDPWIRPHLSTLREGRKIPYSLNGLTAPMDMISGQLDAEERELTFQGLGLPETTLTLPLLGRHNASNLLAAIAVAAGLGLTAEEIKEGLKLFKGAEGRSEIRELPGPSWVLCDYYNAQPASVLAGFQLLNQLSQRSSKSKVRWVCLGDMLELGPEEEQFHRELATPMIEQKFEHVLLYGPRMMALLDELEKRGFKGNASHFSSHADLTAALTHSARPGDTIMIKGSRGMKMEEVWKVLESYAKTHWSRNLESPNPSPHS